MATTIYIMFYSAIIEQKVSQLISLCTQLMDQHKPSTLYFGFSSTGGNVSPGITLYNFLRSLPINIIMHNIGSVDSVANIVFLAGKERYASCNSSFLFHGLVAQFEGKTDRSIQQLREVLSVVEQNQTMIEDIIIQSTKITREEIRRMFLQGEAKDPSFAVEKGYIQAIKDFSVAPGTPVISMAP